jgi:hypothetical protein
MWTEVAFDDVIPSVFTTLLHYGVSPAFITFQNARAAGVGRSSNNTVDANQTSNFDGNGPFLTNTPIASPSGTPIAFISNHDADAATNGNTLVGSSISQTFFVPTDATQLTLLARQLSNEGLNTASAPNGATVGADFGGVALHIGDALIGQFVFDQQSPSPANFHVTNFSPDGSVGFGGFISGTPWQSLLFNMISLRGQTVTLTAFQVNTGDINIESRLLISNVQMDGTPVVNVAAEPATILLIGAGFAALLAVRRRRA